MFSRNNNNNKGGNVITQISGFICICTITTSRRDDLITLLTFVEDEGTFSSNLLLMACVKWKSEYAFT